MTQFVTRQQAGLAPPDVRHLSRRSDPVIGITVHITDTGPGDPLGTWRAIQHAEMSGNDPDHAVYGDISYNAGVSLDGRLIAGRDDHFLGAHARSHDNVANRMTLGVAVICRATDPPTDAARAAIRAAGYLFSVAYRRPPLWLGHRDFDAPDGSHTACPDQWYAFVEQLRNHH